LLIGSLLLAWNDAALRAFGNNEPLARAQLLGATEDGLRDTEEVCHETASA